MNWIEPEHESEAAKRVLERCLWKPSEIADDSVKFYELCKTIVQLYACGKSRSERGDLILAAMDEYVADLIRDEAETVLDEESEDEYLRDYNEAFINRRFA